MNAPEITYYLGIIATNYEMGANARNALRDLIAKIKAGQEDAGDGVPEPASLRPFNPFAGLPAGTRITIELPAKC